jgi:hypothetical protein
LVSVSYALYQHMHPVHRLNKQLLTELEAIDTFATRGGVSTTCGIV